MSAPIPTIGEIRQFYCQCIESSRAEKYRDSTSRTEERTFTERKTADKTEWIIKAHHKGDFSRGAGLFSSGIAMSYWEYFWECLNCHKRTVIGVWDSDGANYGDGSHIAYKR